MISYYFYSKVIKGVPPMKIVLIRLILCFSFLTITSTVPAVGKTLPLSVFVSIQPQAYFVERIGGGRVSVSILVPPGKNPATYSPTPFQMSKLSKAKIFFRIGVPFENTLMPKIKSSAKKLEIVDTRKGIHLRSISGGPDQPDMKKNYKQIHEEHGHGHETTGADPHIWLNPLLVKMQAETIYKNLVRLDPDGKDHYLGNLKIFGNDLEKLNNRISEALAPIKGSVIFVFHPAFGYFCDAYGLRQMAVEMEGKAPKIKELSRFIKLAKNKNVRVIFVQPQFDRNAARKIAGAIKGAVISLDPLSRNYIQNLEEMADKVFRALNNK